jgi:hypothetical protein
MPDTPLHQPRDHGQSAWNFLSRLFAQDGDVEPRRSRSLTATLEREGVERFAASFEQLFAEIEAKRDGLVRA